MIIPAVISVSKDIDVTIRFGLLTISENIRIMPNLHLEYSLLGNINGPDNSGRQTEIVCEIHIL